MDDSVDKLIDIIKEAKSIGYNGIVITDYKFGRIKEWLNTADKVDGVMGVMYTTWRDNYSHLQVFYESLNDHIGIEE